jgi:hypothetical protein
LASASNSLRVITVLQIVVFLDLAEPVRGFASDFAASQSPWIVITGVLGPIVEDLEVPSRAGFAALLD